MRALTGKGGGSKVQEGYVSKAALTATLCWGVVGVLLTTAWVLGLTRPENWIIVGLLAASACVFSAIAVVLHSRLYVNRLVRVIRLTSQSDGESADLYRIDNR